MAHDIHNTATITAYKYLSGGREIIGNSTFDTVVNEYVEPSITLVKVCTDDVDPTCTGADLNELITMTITVTNTCQADIVYTEGVVIDNIFTNNSIHVIPDSESGGTRTGNTITLDLGTGLAKGESATYTAKIQVTAPDAPIDILKTHATATLSTAAGYENEADDMSDLNYHHAEITVSKRNAPTGIVMPGEEITYEISIGNYARTNGTIGIGEFVDPIPEYTEFIRINVNQDQLFAYDPVESKITNISEITLSYGQTKLVSFTVKALKQT